MKIVTFLGYSGAGKTTALTCIARGIRNTGGTIGTVKHVHKKSFTVDKAGKDTWLHARAGASVVVTVSPSEISIIRKEKNADRSISLERLLKIVSSQYKPIDFLLVEGLHTLFSRRKDVLKVICARSENEAMKLIKLHGRVLFVTGKIADGKNRSYHLAGDIPVLSLPRNTKLALKLISANRL